jgi:tetratricopeptide (TPR) repeat protein
MNRRIFGFVLLGVILGSPLLLTGGNEALFTVLLGLTLLLCFLFLLTQPIDGALKVPLRLFLAFIGCQLLTLIPLPVSWIRWLSPGLHKVLLNFPEVAYHTLTWDAILTMKTLAIYVAAAGVFLVAYHLWEDPLEKVPFVVQLFFWTGAFWVAVSLWLHYATPGRVPFLPWQPEPWFFGLFTNENIFGAYCAMLIPIGIALSVQSVRRWQAAPGMAPLAGLAIVLVAYALIASRSVGAWGAAVIALLAYWMPYRRFTLPAVLAAAGAAVLYFGPRFGGEAYRSLVDRLGFAGLAARGLTSVPLSGGGLGTTAILAGRYQAPLGDHIVDKIHNDWLELLFCAGHSGLLLFAVLLLFGRKLARLYKRGRILRAGLAGAVLTLGLHSLVDFPVQNFTVLATGAFLMGAVVRMEEPVSWDGARRARAPLLVLLAASLLVQGLSILGLAAVRRGRASAWQPVRSMALIRGDGAAVARLLSRHSLMAPMWGELALAEEKAGRFDRASEGIRRAIVLQPTNPKLHVVAARISFVSEDGDRFLHDLIEAFALEPADLDKAFPLTQAQVERLVEEGGRRAHGYYGKGAAGHYHWGYAMLKRNDSQKRAALIEDAAGLFPEVNSILFAAGEESLASRRLDRAREYADRALALRASPYNAALLARVLAAAGDPGGAESALRRALDLARTGEEAAMVISWAPECILGASHERIIAFAEEGFNRFPNAIIACVIGRLFRQEGGGEEAVRWYERSIQLDPAAEYAYRELLPMLRAAGDMQRLAIYEPKAARLFPGAAWLGETAAP